MKANISIHILDVAVRPCRARAIRSLLPFCSLIKLSIDANKPRARKAPDETGAAHFARKAGSVGQLLGRYGFRRVDGKYETIFSAVVRSRTKLGPNGVLAKHRLPM